MAWALGRQGADTDALHHAHENLRLSRELDDPVSQAHALNAVAWFTARLGDLDRARSFGESALALDPNPEGAASCRETLGYLEFHAGRPAESVEHYQRALTLRRAHGYLRHVANTLDRMVPPLLALGRAEEAEASAQEAQELLSRLRMTHHSTVPDSRWPSLAVSARRMRESPVNPAVIGIQVDVAAADDGDDVAAEETVAVLQDRGDAEGG
jgi:tetratricopeptide (TPR) repeat protein